MYIVVHRRFIVIYRFPHNSDITFTPELSRIVFLVDYKNETVVQ